ncbi:ABC transporter permease [Streptomyces himalayensis]|uniref:ABC transporter permease n=1 Tax=Streptomyces himalayensis subsp. himalayensis TaxID=2756131 RepID=A0A7W0I886_9ACTN|nr:ABC transporter permease subunit [Streptomyces himalayensis]MBA2945978.1 ABC transporter permease [Streptomyces himalayensis subsp. himalayensis]
MSTTALAPHDTPETAGRHAAGQRVTFPRVVHMEWIKLRSLRSTIYTLAITVALVVGFGLLLSSVVGSGEGPGQDDFGDPTSISLGGVTLAALAISVLGVLMSAGEYATGTIRATLSAVPARLPVLWGKVVVFAAVSFVLMFIAALGAFLAGQSVLSSRDMATAALSDPGVFRALVGAAVYLTGAGLIGLAVGALLRNTAGAITLVVGALFVVPGLIQLLPSSWNDAIGPYLPSNAGNSFMAVQTTGDALSPGAGLAVFAGYIVVLLAGAAVLLKRRDA